ncbi:hypothetical protein ACHAQI_003283 [Fusarium lateritium]
MRRFISIAAILGAVGVIAVPDHAAIELNTFCVTYLSTYLVPISQNASLSTGTEFEGLSTLTSGQLTVEPPLLTTVDGTTYTLTDQPGLTSNPTDSITSLAPGEIASSVLASLNSQSSVLESLSSRTETGTLTDEPPLLTTIDLGTTTITAIIPTSSGVIEPLGQSIILAVNLDNSNQERSVHKRTLGGFVGPNDPNVCTFASTFNFAQDQLFVSGLPVFYSPGDSNKELIGGDNLPGDAITRGFTTAGGALGFNNADLPGGAASFCQTVDGRVFIVFTEGPPECTPVNLLVYGATSQAISTDSATISGSTQSAEDTTSDAPPSPSSEFQSAVSLDSTTEFVAGTETVEASSTTFTGISTESNDPDSTTATSVDSTSQPTLDSSQLPETVATTVTEVMTSNVFESATETVTGSETSTADETTTADTTTEEETETTSSVIDTTISEVTTAEETTTIFEDTTTAAEDTTITTEETTTAAEDTTTTVEDTTTAAEDTTTAEDITTAAEDTTTAEGTTTAAGDTTTTEDTTTAAEESTTAEDTTTTAEATTTAPDATTVNPTTTEDMTDEDTTTAAIGDTTTTEAPVITDDTTTTAEQVATTTTDSAPT